MTDHQSQPQPPADLTTLYPQFRDAIQDLTHQWGFIVIRTAYDTEESQWETALSKLRAYATPVDSSAEMHPSTFALPVISDRTLLRDADVNSVRKAFNGWVHDFMTRNKNSHDDDNNDSQNEDYSNPWPSDLRRDSFIIIDTLSLTSLLNAPLPVPSHSHKPQPWVTVVDTETPLDPENPAAWYHGGGPYLGFTRASVWALSDLYDELECDLSLEQRTRPREYENQIPLYDGLDGKLVDPEDGVLGRRFIMGTPRGCGGGRGRRGPPPGAGYVE
ncbi:hypothetical protein M011DRAFT_485407 [Sporormia fimetaria CBS 119925]|uniref:Uncharacterized protein n=1 Tax=Sporormia fimetaria CBS 119925 TaxID=1340428 RepID=A0A6A6VG87_9PLEO|nr:hypothetical protein M011DRAFT_485407 [Sporormia fimetaria CBS 119925]